VRQKSRTAMKGMGRNCGLREVVLSTYALIVLYIQ
jgi:hypothetical protein